MTPRRGCLAIAEFVKQHLHGLLAALTIHSKVISIEDWDAFKGFSPAVRDEQTFRQRPKQTLAGHRDKTKPFISWGYQGHDDR